MHFELVCGVVLWSGLCCRFALRVECFALEFDCFSVDYLVWRLRGCSIALAGIFVDWFSLVVCLFWLFCFPVSFCFVGYWCLYLGVLLLYYSVCCDYCGWAGFMLLVFTLVFIVLSLCLLDVSNAVLFGVLYWLFVLFWMFVVFLCLALKLLFWMFVLFFNCILLVWLVGLYVLFVGLFWIVLVRRWFAVLLCLNSDYLIVLLYLFTCLLIC